MTNQSHSFIGNLTRDPEIKTVTGPKGDTSVVSFAVAVNGRTQTDTAFFECEAWGGTADTIAKWFKKGKPIIINDAEAKMENWVDKTSGEKRSRLKFRVNRFGFLPGGKEDDTEEETQAEENTPAPAPTPTKTKSTAKRAKQTVPPESPGEDDDIPF